METTGPGTARDPSGDHFDPVRELSAQRRWKDARQACEEILATHPDDPRARTYIVGDDLRAARITLKEARRLIDGLVMQFPDAAAPYARRAVLRPKKEREQALRELQEAPEAFGDDPALIDALPYVHLRAGNYADALTFYKRALEQNRPLTDSTRWGTYRSASKEGDTSTASKMLEGTSRFDRWLHDGRFPRARWRRPSILAFFAASLVSMVLPSAWACPVLLGMTAVLWAPDLLHQAHEGRGRAVGNLLMCLASLAFISVMLHLWFGWDARVSSPAWLATWCLIASASLYSVVAMAPSGNGLVRLRRAAAAVLFFSVSLPWFILHLNLVAGATTQQSVGRFSELLGPGGYFYLAAGLAILSFLLDAPRAQRVGSLRGRALGQVLIFIFALDATLLAWAPPSGPQVQVMNIPLLDLHASWEARPFVGSWIAGALAAAALGFSLAEFLRVISTRKRPAEPEKPLNSA